MTNATDMTTGADQDAFDAWRQARWEEVAGPFGKARVVANGRIAGPAPQTIPGVPGQWRVTPEGELYVTAAASDGMKCDGQPVAGPVKIPPGSQVDLPPARTVFVSGGGGAFGLVVMDEDAVRRSGLTGIETYPHDPSWVLPGEYRAVPPGREVEVARLTVPRSRDTLPAPVDLAVTIGGEERVLTVLEDLPGRRLLIFTDETNGAGSTELGRWLLLPAQDPGASITVDFNRSTVTQHYFSPAVFTCPTEPAGNHLPFRIEAGERALIFRRDDSQSHHAQES